MAKFLIQEYDRDMRNLITQSDEEFDSNEEAVLAAYYRAESADVVVLMRRNTLDPTRLVKIAKFY